MGRVSIPDYNFNSARSDHIPDIRNMVKYGMTPKEFDSTPLPRKLNMREYEAARLVLVHDAKVSAAAKLYDLSENQVEVVIALFKIK